jgi:hypothetical protein
MASLGGALSVAAASFDMMGKLIEKTKDYSDALVFDVGRDGRRQQAGMHFILSARSERYRLLARIHVEVRSRLL